MASGCDWVMNNFRNAMEVHSEWHGLLQLEASDIIGCGLHVENFEIKIVPGLPNLS